ncbi:PucR family transcriptional regulator [Alloiococcus sp. CFN-8]|uniref:PucR family transcriptional regulator n=1 Tax=Alloiococcus sp. CFN-8 TaxID=3416081 RepID=UPI003CF872CA
MAVNFDILLSKLTEYEIEVSRSRLGNLSYKEVRLLYDKELAIEKNVLYLGYLSMISERVPTLKDIGLILIKDCNLSLLPEQADIALFPYETNIFKLFDMILNIFHSNRKIVDSSAELLNSLIKGKGLDYIVQVGSEILGNPVFLVDASSKLLASSINTAIDDTFWNDLSSLGYGNDKNLTPYVHEGFVNQVINNPQPVLITPRTPNNLKRIVGKIKINDNIIGYIGVLENNRKLKTEDVQITELLCDVIASEMQKSKLYDNLTGVKHEFLIVDLLEERIGNESMAKERAKALFPVVNKNIFVAAVNIVENSTNSRLLSYLRWTFEVNLPSCKSAYYNENIILVINTKSNNQWQEIKKSLINILKRNNLIAGLSIRFENIIDIRKYYIQAERASKLGKLLKKDAVLFDYDDLYVHDMLNNLNKDINPKDFCHPGILKIQDYDKSYGTDYYTTLYEYLICGGNITLTANRLFTHRNTVVHRIAKIQEITDIDISDGNNRFKLLLSYRIMELSE